MSKLGCDIKRIIDHYGVLTQQLKAIEELAELQRAIARIILNPNSAEARENLIEEIADVLIMIDQVSSIHFIKNIEIETEINFKIERTLERIKNESV